MTNRRLTQTCLRVHRSLRRRRGLEVVCCMVRALSAAVRAWDLLKQVTSILIQFSSVQFSR